MERHLGDWDQNMQCYPHFECDGRTFLLYNGNEFGHLVSGGELYLNSEVSILKYRQWGLLSTCTCDAYFTRVEHASGDRRLRPKADR